MPCKIKKRKKRKKYVIGGNISGASHDNGGVIIEAEGGEYIVNKKAVNPETEAVLEYINTYGKLPRAINAKNRRKK